MFVSHLELADFRNYESASLALSPGPNLVVGTDRLIAVSAPDKHGRPVHRLPAEGKSTAVHLLNYSAESGLGRILRVLNGQILDRLHAPNVLTAHLASVLRTMALDGRGLAWLPQMLVGDDFARVSHVPIFKRTPQTIVNH